MAITAITLPTFLFANGIGLGGISYIKRAQWWKNECSGVCHNVKETYKKGKRTRTKTVKAPAPTEPICGYLERAWIDGSEGKTAKVSGYDTIVWHHDGPGHATDQSPNLVSLVYFHREKQGFHDLSYHFVIKRERPGGAWKIYEGTPLGYVGCHVSRCNFTDGTTVGKIGIMVAGDYDFQQPDADLIDVMKRLQKALVSRYHITRIATHRDGPLHINDGRGCPGKNLVPVVNKLAEGVNRRAR